MLISIGFGASGVTAGKGGLASAGTMGSKVKVSACIGSGKKFAAGAFGAVGTPAKGGAGGAAGLFPASGNPKSDSEKKGVPKESMVGPLAGFGAGAMTGAGVATGGGEAGLEVSRGVEKGSPKGLAELNGEAFGVVGTGATGLTGGGVTGGLAG